MEGYVFKYPRAQGHKVTDQSEPDALLKRRAGSDAGLVRLIVEGHAWWERVQLVRKEGQDVSS